MIAWCVGRAPSMLRSPPRKRGPDRSNKLALPNVALDSRIGVRKHAVLRTAMRGNERGVGQGASNYALQLASRAAGRAAPQDCVWSPLPPFTASLIGSIRGSMREA